MLFLCSILPDLDDSDCLGHRDITEAGESLLFASDAWKVVDIQPEDICEEIRVGEITAVELESPSVLKYCVDVRERHVDDGYLPQAD